MNENQRIVLRKQERRYQLLLALWKATEGNEHIRVNLTEIAKSIGIDEKEAIEIQYYFAGENFFNAEYSGGYVRLSHRAIVEVENSLNHPNQSTEHFSSTVIQQYFNAPVGVVQTGNNFANVSQNIGEDISEVLNELNSWKNQFQSLPMNEKDEAIDVVDALAEEIQKENPSKGKLKAFLLATKDFAVKVGVDFAASTTAKLIESQVGIKSS